MSKFVLDSDSLLAIADSIKALSNKMGDVASSIDSCDVGDSEEFDFAGAKAAILNNVEGAVEKINNTEILISKVLEKHASIQNSLKFDFSNIISNEKSNYTVEKGDNLSYIASKNGITVNDILKENQNIKDPDFLPIGLTLVIPSASKSTNSSLNGSSLNSSNSTNNSISNSKSSASNLINNDSDQTLSNGKTISVPEGLGKVHTYMGWQLITSKTSNQYKLKEAAGMNFDSEGFGKIGDRYVVATTTKFGNVGDYVDFKQADGSIIKGIIGDIKNQNDRGCNEWGHNNGQTIVEFVVDKNSWYNCGHSNPGSSNCHPEWKQSIVSSTNYGNYFDKTA